MLVEQGISCDYVPSQFSPLRLIGLKNENCENAPALIILQIASFRDRRRSAIEDKASVLCFAFFFQFTVQGSSGNTQDLGGFNAISPA